ncbi:MAG: acyl-CoA dehydrogenase [Acidimicrobiales bacterium]
MSDYRAPIKDALFTLRHIGEIEDLAKTERYAHADYDTVASVLEEQGRFMQEVFGPLNRTGDVEGLKLENGVVTTPSGFKEAYAKFVDAGWQGLNAEEEFGGAGFPEAVFTLALEFMTAANGALTMCPGLTTGAIECLQHWGTEEQKEVYLRKLVTGEWTGTMNLTEPQAGSDVGLCTTKAEPQGDGTYKISGTKIFISFGEHDMAENIIHLVLARIPGAAPGTKGISLFLVPKFMVNADGSLGDRNDVSCVSIEHKMGIHASPTCVLSYGDEGGAIGFLVGEEGQGMRAMFTMMNSARLAVGIQGVALGDAAYQKALIYSQERKQGKAIGGGSHEPAFIIEHPDVRRMLMMMRSQIDAMRALICYNAAAIDFSRTHSDPELKEQWSEIAELLTPVTKAWCTDVGMDVTSTAIQIFGGMGFIEESGVAQHFRDARIAPIYEGTNGIQAMDLVGRKLPMRMGGVVNDHFARIRATIAELEGTTELKALAAPLQAGLESLEAATNWIFENGLADPKEALAGATPYLEMFGVVTGGWFSARLALAALGELNDGSDDTGYLKARIASASFFIEQLVPRAAGYLPSVTAGASGLYEIDATHLASA